MLLHSLSGYVTISKQKTEYLSRVAEGLAL